MQPCLDDLFAFLTASPSAFHAVEESAARLRRAGFVPLCETGPWSLVPGGAYYVTRNQSSLIAFRLPAAPLTGWRIAAAHSDSPTYAVKCGGRAEEAMGYAKLSAEGYGGMNAATWLDRPLTVAGRVLVRTAEGVEGRLVYLDRDLLTIPSLAIHLDRGLNSGHNYDPKKDMQPLYGLAGTKSLPALLAEALGVAGEDILDTDLTLCVRQAPVRLGPEGELIQAPRLDDLEGAWGTLAGFLDAPQAAEGVAAVWCLFDSEEVGSGTRQGACGSFLPDVLARCAASLGLDADAQRAALAGSFALCADNAHAVHPNFPEMSDPRNTVRPGGGVVLKYNARQKYTTTGLTGALFRELCRRAGVPVQVYANRADLPGGSTLGHLLTAQVSVPMADIGLAQLAMHSCVETASARDAVWMRRAVAAYYAADFACTADGAYTIRG